MALQIGSRNITGASAGRFSVRCGAVPLGHVHFPPPAISPAREPATEIVSTKTYDTVTKPFLVVQAPANLLMNTDSMYLLAFDDKSDTDIPDTQDVIGDFWAWVSGKAKTQLDGQQTPDDRLDNLQQKKK